MVHLLPTPKKFKLTMSSDNIGSFSSSFRLDSGDYDFSDIISAEGSLFAFIRWGSSRKTKLNALSAARGREAPVIMSVKTRIVSRCLVEASFVICGRSGGVAWRHKHGVASKMSYIRGHGSGTCNQSLKFIFRKTKWLAVMSYRLAQIIRGKRECIFKIL